MPQETVEQTRALTATMLTRSLVTIQGITVAAVRETRGLDAGSGDTITPTLLRALAFSCV